MSNDTTTRDLALVGGGYWGKNLARNFHALGSLHTICDSNPSALAQFGEDYSRVKKTGDFQAILRDEHVRKVAIATPAVCHYEQVRAALLAGKDVFVEKPLCLNAAQGEELVELAEHKGLVLMVGHLLQYHPCIGELYRMITLGELGRLYYITSNRLNLGKIRREENALWSFAPHDISVILSLAGGQMPICVRCMGESYLNHKVADATLTFLRFAGGLCAHIYVSWLNPFKEQRLTVVGSEGLVVFDDTMAWPEKLRIHRRYLRWQDGQVPIPNRSDGETIHVEPVEPLFEECRHFLSCCQDRTPAKTNGREALRVLRILESAQQSLERDGESLSFASHADQHSVRLHLEGYTFSTRSISRSHSDAYVDPSACMGEAVTLGYGARILSNAHIGTGVHIGRYSTVGHSVYVGDHVTIGNDVFVSPNACIQTGVQIEDSVLIGSGSVISAGQDAHRHTPSRCGKGVRIGTGATIGPNVLIMPSVSVGRYAVIAGGAVVSADVPDHTLLAPREWIAKTC